MYSGQQLKMGIGSSSYGSFSSKLSLGAVYDSYRSYVVVDIIDNDNGVTTYQIANPVVVKPDTSLLDLITSELSNPSGQNSLTSILYSGDSQVTTQTISAISSLLNGASLSDQLALASLGKELIFSNIFSIRLFWFYLGILR